MLGLITVFYYFLNVLFKLLLIIFIGFLEFALFFVYTVFLTLKGWILFLTISIVLFLFYLIGEDL